MVKSIIRDFMLDRWKGCVAPARERLTFELAAHLPAGFEPKQIRRCELGGQTHFVAMFGYHGAEFALVPGGIVTLGYDRKTPFHPSCAQLESWNSTVRELARLREQGAHFAIEPSLERYLDAVSSPFRTVAIDPFLMEVNATEAAVEPLSLDAPEVRS